MVNQWHRATLIATWLVLCRPAVPGAEIPITWEYRGEVTIPQRVILSFSPDGGQHWTRQVAYGVPSSMGTNQYDWSVPRGDPEYCTERGRIRLQELNWRGEIVGTNQTSHTLWSDNDFVLAGIVLLTHTTNTLARVGQEIHIWAKCAGVGNLVSLGISTNGAATFTALGIREAVKGTNVWAWTPSGVGMQQPGSVRICFQSVADPKCQAVSGPILISP